MSDLYEEDIVLWSERQGELLRRRAAGELVNEAELDWPNIAEEIESVGNEQRFAMESLLVQAIAHMLKAQAWPDCRDAPTWRADAMRFRGDAVARSSSATTMSAPICANSSATARPMPRPAPVTIATCPCSSM
jgi:hypothetical protein